MTPGVPAGLMREVQGNILRAYGNEYRVVRHLVFSVDNPVSARRALGLMVNGDRATPDVTSGDRPPKEAGFVWCLNIGLTYAGLLSLGVPATSLATFPSEFRQGMVARAARLGDIGVSAPSHWMGGLADTERVHLIVTIHGRVLSDIDRVSEQVLEAGGGRAFSPVSQAPFDGQAMFDDRTGQRIVHFGYADGISQPRFVGDSRSGRLPQPLAVRPYRRRVARIPERNPSCALGRPAA